VSRVYKATIKCVAADGTLFQPGLHYQTDLTDLTSEPDPDDVATAIWNHLQPGFQPITPSNTVITSLDVREQVIAPAIGVAGTHVVDAVGTHLQGDDKLPKGMCSIIRFKTSTSSRSARGYTTPPPVLDSAILTQEKWSSGYLALLNAFADLLNDSLSLGSVNPSDLHPVCFSRTRFQANQTPYTFRVNAAIVNETPHWRRSRMTSP